MLPSHGAAQCVTTPGIADGLISRVPVWRRRAATLAAGALAVVMGYGVVFGHNGLTAFARKREETRELQQQMLRLEQENAHLREHVERLNDDPSAIEHEARAGLHYMRAGEVTITLPSAEPQTIAPSAIDK